jgi:multidrug efflux pump subunit AcrB
MGISTPFILRPIATSLLMAGVLAVGAVAYPFLPVAPLPQVDFPTIRVTTQLPGASPEMMASSVTAPLERQFAQIAGVAQMTSSSTLANSSITVQFDLNRNIDAAAQDILTAIKSIRPTRRFSLLRCIPTRCPLPSPTITLKTCWSRT